MEQLLKKLCTVKFSVQRLIDSFFGLPLNIFRILSFWMTLVLGLPLQVVKEEEFCFFDDVQRSFYSGYFVSHGFKVQASILPNSMFSSIYLASMRVSDSGLLHMSGLDNYLSSLFCELNITMINKFDQYPAVYGDNIFSQLATIVARYSSPNENENENRTNVHLSSMRQSIEHIFVLHKE